MKFNGIVIPRDGGKVDGTALYSAWKSRDEEQQSERWDKWYKNFCEVMAERGAWLPHVHAWVLAFYQSKQFSLAKISKDTVASMVAGNMINGGVAPITQQKQVEAVVGDYINDNTSLTRDPGALFWQDNARGKNAGIYISPPHRADGVLAAMYAEALEALKPPPAEEPAGEGEATNDEATPPAE